MSKAEDDVLSFILSAGFPEPQQQAMLVPGRRYRTDFYWPEYRVALEVEGGVHIRGRHVTPTGFEKDIRKYNAITGQGIALYRVMPQHTKAKRGEGEPYLLTVLKTIFG